MMRSETDQPGVAATKLTAIGIFLALFGAFSVRVVRRRQSVDVGPFDVLLLGLSAFRAGRLIAYERIAAPLRAPVTETSPDSSGAGDTVVARGRGVQWALGELLSCPVCVGTWAAAGLVYGLLLAPRPTRVLLTILGSTGIAELLHCSSEALAWLGRAARREVGTPSPDREA